ncbi:MAG: DUF2079 domain-containing protein [Saccharofermentanales bacterium]
MKTPRRSVVRQILWSLLLAYVLTASVSLFFLTRSGDLLYREATTGRALGFQALGWVVAAAVMYVVLGCVPTLRRSAVFLLLCEVFVTAVAWRSHDPYVALSMMIASVPLLYGVSTLDVRPHERHVTWLKTAMFALFVTVGVAWLVYTMLTSSAVGQKIGEAERVVMTYETTYRQLGRWAVSVLAGLLLADVYLRASSSRRWRSLRGTPVRAWGVVAIALIPLIFATVLTVMRVKALYVPTYDMGIFTQMFHNMLDTGEPVTTLERDRLLSHFAVHVSPIYYLMLPFFAISPRAETLQVLQGVIVASAAIPLTLIAKRLLPECPHVRAVVVALFLLHPGVVTGGLYDLHENCFLAPLILWLVYFVIRRQTVGVVILTLLLLMVKEDAALYAIAVGLFAWWGTTQAQTRAERRRDVMHGAIVVGLSVIYFIVAVTALEQTGTGAMFSRYNNMMLHEDWGMLGVAVTAIQNPAYTLAVMARPLKLGYVSVMLLAFGGGPLFQKHAGNFALMIPLAVMNLVSDYPYQHTFGFQYHYGTTALMAVMLLIALREQPWLVPSNATDERPQSASSGHRGSAVGAVMLSIGVAVGAVQSVAVLRDKKAPIAHYRKYSVEIAEMREAMAQIPTFDTVGATTYLTTPLASHFNLYDLKYHDQPLEDGHLTWLVIDGRWGDKKYRELYDRATAAGYIETDLSTSKVTILRWSGP